MHNSHKRGQGIEKKVGSASPTAVSTTSVCSMCLILTIAICILFTYAAQVSVCPCSGATIVSCPLPTETTWVCLKIGYIPNEIAIFHRDNDDNDQQNHWV